MTFILLMFFNTWRSTIFNKLQRIILIKIIWLIWLINLPFTWLRIFALHIWLHLRMHRNQPLFAAINCVRKDFLNNIFSIHHLNFYTAVILFIQLTRGRLIRFVRSCFYRQLNFILLIGLVLIATFVGKIKVLTWILRVDKTSTCYST